MINKIKTSRGTHSLSIAIDGQDHLRDWNIELDFASAVTLEDMVTVM